MMAEAELQKLIQEVQEDADCAARRPPFSLDRPHLQHFVSHPRSLRHGIVSARNALAVLVLASRGRFQPCVRFRSVAPKTCRGSHETLDVRLEILLLGGSAATYLREEGTSGTTGMNFGRAGVDEQLLRTLLLDQIWPTLAGVAPSWTEVGQSLANIGQYWSKLCRSVGQLLYTSGTNRSSFWTTLGQL